MSDCDIYTIESCQDAGPLPHPWPHPWPERLYIPSLFCLPTTKTAKPLLWGKNAAGQTLPLFSFDETTQRSVFHFDVTGLAAFYRYERYSNSLKRNIESYLPFNYSRLPFIAKRWAQSLKQNRNTTNCQQPIFFPAVDGIAEVDWLEACRGMLASSAENTGITWPQNNEAALFLSFDVDTDWLWHEQKWLNRILETLAHLNIAATFFCVPAYCQSQKAQSAISQILSEGHEVACHGFNHDTKLPFVNRREFERRKKVLLEFRDKWQIQGFRSEWLYRSESFLNEIAAIFKYDSSIPRSSLQSSKPLRRGCATNFPFQWRGKIWELPLTLPMDVEVFSVKQTPEVFWREQLLRAQSILAQQALLTVTVHPQPHQSANERVFPCIVQFLTEVQRQYVLWAARGKDIVREFSIGNR